MRVLVFRVAATLTLLGGLITACSTNPDTRPSATAEAPTPVPIAKPAPGACANCGQVERIETFTTPARKPVGPMQGGVLGGVLSKPAAATATQATAAPTRSFRVSLKLDDGRHVALYQASISPNLKVGSRVRVEKGRIVLLR